HRRQPAPNGGVTSVLSPLAVARPGTGHDLLRTASDPSGTRIIGTLNNCSSGFTPWGTYLACEEHWHNYFLNRDAEDLASRTAHARYGVSGGEDRKSVV